MVRSSSVISHEKKKFKLKVNIMVIASWIARLLVVADPIMDGVHTTIGNGLSGSVSSNSLSRNGAPGNGARHVISYSPVASSWRGISGF